MNRDEIPPGTLYLLILKNLALRREVQGCRFDPKRPGIVLQGGEHSLGAITRVIQTA